VRRRQAVQAPDAQRERLHLELYLQQKEVDVCKIKNTLKSKAESSCLLNSQAFRLADDADPHVLIVKQIRRSNGENARSDSPVIRVTSTAGKFMFESKYLGTG
jgi:hypothetical protein